MILIQDISEQAERLLSINNVTIQGVLLVVILVSWVIIWHFWKLNKELNAEIRGFIEKYYTLSTKILSYISKGKDV